MITFLLGCLSGAAFALLLTQIIGSSVTFKQIKNKDKKPTANDTYWLLSSKGNQFLFTDEQLKVASIRASKNIEDLEA